MQRAALGWGSPLLWLGGGHKSGKPSFRQEVEAPGDQWCLTEIICGNNHLEFNPKFQQMYRNSSLLSELVHSY